jgi:hypothetical protein
MSEMRQNGFSRTNAFMYLMVPFCQAVPGRRTLGSVNGGKLKKNQAPLTLMKIKENRENNAKNRKDERAKM